MSTFTAYLSSIFLSILVALILSMPNSLTKNEIYFSVHLRYLLYIEKYATPCAEYVLSWLEAFPPLIYFSF